MSGLAKTHVKSAWTPLSNDKANQRMFEERRQLVSKWFDHWTDAQRKRVLEDLLTKCKSKQLEFTGNLVRKKKPAKAEDFTSVLPRVLSLYIFSYLDPRSLSRCAQVCWHWKYVTELDQMWMKKCVRLGWVLPFTPSPYEHGVWKRLYVENVSSLKFLAPQDLGITPRSARTDVGDGDKGKKRTPRPRSASGDRRKPWRGSDPNPTDMYRNNYLDNDDERGKIDKLRRTGQIPKEILALTKSVKSKLNTGQHAPVSRPSSAMSRSKSSSGIWDSTYTGIRPDWAKGPSTDVDTNTNGVHNNTYVLNPTNGTPDVTGKKAHNTPNKTVGKGSPMKATLPLKAASKQQLKQQQQKIVNTNTYNPSERNTETPDFFADTTPWQVQEEYDSDT